MSEVLRSHACDQGIEIQLIQGDITRVKAEGIVNPANSQLAHGGGLAGLLAQKGGPEIQAESDAWIREHGTVSHGSPAHTGAGNLPFKTIIHAVGPVWGSGEEEDKLRAAVQGSLEKGAELGLASLALPAISTGIFAYPLDQAAEVILNATREYILEDPPAAPKQILIVLYDDRSAAAFTAAWDRIYP